MRDLPINEKLIIIDTNEYAGNFEREMVAYITGWIGDCGVGKEAAKVAEYEVEEEILEWFDIHVVDVPDETGCFRPASISLTPETDKYNSVEFVVGSWPPGDVSKVILNRAKSFCVRYWREHSKLSRSSHNLDKEIPFVGVRWVERTVQENTVLSFT